MSTQSKKLSRRIAIAVLCFVLLGALGLTAVFRPISAIADQDQPGQFTSDYRNLSDTQAAARALNQEIVNEGMVLLKNEDNALPMAKGSSVTLMGKAAGSPIYTGGGSGAASSRNPQTIEAALTGEAGFSVGTAFTTGGSTISGTNTGSSTYTVGSTERSTFATYNDAAIVVFGRVGAENMSTSTNYSDLAVTGISSEHGHILGFDANERNLLSIANENFDKVIVVICSTNAMELGSLMDGTYENVKAVIMAGIPGPEGYNALGRILVGDVNPSGRLVDTYVRDITKDPTWTNWGTNSQAGGVYSFYTGTTASRTAFGTFYKEGIYLGYKYYETAWYEHEQGNYEDFDYDEAIVFPFGYGLSYTDFEWEILSYTNNEVSLTQNSTITVKVKVTNTGDVAGKDVVELYYTAPYTPGEVEKSYKTLGDFGKTRLLEPGESDVVTLNISLRDMASYDYSDANNNGNKGYEADAGEYVLHISKNSHDSVLQLTYNLDNDVLFKTAKNTGYEVVNQLDDVSNFYEDRAKVFSRANFADTFPTTTKQADLTVDSTFVAPFSKSFSYSNSFADNATGNGGLFRDKDNPWYVEEMPAYGQTLSRTIMLNELVGLDYDDPLWTQFISQLTVAEMAGNQSIINPGNAYLSRQLSRLGIPQTVDQDGPQSFYSQNGTGIPYATEPVVAATWNKDLAYRQGRMMANEGMWRNLEVWYAPAMNIHRSPFGGRNFEYYSECGVLSGIIGSEVTRGATEKGLVVTLKHYAFNEQETGRANVGVFATEQALREVYLKPFQMSVEEGHALGVMTSFNFIGNIWAGGSYALNTEILINEWGFHGLSITDYGGGNNMHDLMIRAGSNKVMGNSSLTTSGTLTATQIACLQEACHNLLYAKANSYAMQTRRSQTGNVFSAIAEGTATLDYSGKSMAALTGEEFMDNLTVATSLGDTVTYAVTEGSLPAGLTLDANGLLHGTPTASGTFTFTVTATGASNGLVYNGTTATAEFTINVTSTRFEYDPKPNMKEGRVGFEYEDTVDTAVGGSFVYSSNEVPAGLTLDPDGRIHGIPTEAGEFTFTVKATADAGELTQQFTINIVAADAKLVYNPFALDAARIGSEISVDLGRATGSALITYKFDTRDAIPEGLELSEDGILSGTPTKAGNYSFRVIASAPDFEDVSARFNLLVVEANATIAFEGKALADAAVGQAYSVELKATGASNITYALAQGSSLPVGLTLRDGVISGQPVTVGTYTFSITASAVGFEPVTVQFSIEVKLGTLVYQGRTLNAGSVGSAYNDNVATTDSAVASQASYTLKEGSSLPAGLRLGTDERAIINGTPTVAGTYTFTIIMHVDGYADAEATFTIVVSGDSAEAPEEPADDSNVGVIVGASVGGAAVLGGGIWLVIFLIKKKKQIAG